jgi:hypothetical protein
MPAATRPEQGSSAVAWCCRCRAAGPHKGMVRGVSLPRPPCWVHRRFPCCVDVLVCLERRRRRGLRHGAGRRCEEGGRAVEPGAVAPSPGPSFYLCSPSSSHSPASSAGPPEAATVIRLRDRGGARWRRGRAPLLHPGTDLWSATPHPSSCGRSHRSFVGDIEQGARRRPPVSLS